MMMPGRKFAGDSKCRYGFNGKENDNEVKGEGNEQDYGMRIYDPRIGKFLSVDPLTKSYPHYTPYSFAGNKPIKYVDLDGLEEGPSDEFQPYAEFGIGLVEGFFNLDEEDIILSTTGQPYEKWRMQAWAFRRNMELDQESLEKNGVVQWGIDKANNYYGELKDIVVNGTPRQKGRLAGHVLQIAIPVAAEVKAAFSAEKAMVLETRAVQGADILTEFNPENVSSAYPAPIEAYDRQTHYSRTPTKADRKALGATATDDVDHNTPLVKHYWEGDGDGVPGYTMNKEQRVAFAKDRTKMTVRPRGPNRSEGAALSQYSKEMNKKYNVKKPQK